MPFSKYLDSQYQDSHEVCIAGGRCFSHHMILLLEDMPCDCQLKFNINLFVANGTARPML